MQHGGLKMMKKKSSKIKCFTCGKEITDNLGYGACENIRAGYDNRGKACAFCSDACAAKWFTDECMGMDELKEYMGLGRK
jgi:hypothetical protein